MNQQCFRFVVRIFCLFSIFSRFQQSIVHIHLVKERKKRLDMYITGKTAGKVVIEQKSKLFSVDGYRYIMREYVQCLNNR